MKYQKTQVQTGVKTGVIIFAVAFVLLILEFAGTNLQKSYQKRQLHAEKQYFMNEKTPILQKKNWSMVEVTGFEPESIVSFTAYCTSNSAKWDGSVVKYDTHHII